jgi:hypothetical protein
VSVSFATARDRAGAELAAWVEISGIGEAFSNGAITEANKATLFTDAYTPTLTFRSGLEQLVDAESRSIDLLTGRGRRGGFTIRLVDFVVPGAGAHIGGHLTRLFGSQRSDIQRARLAADVGKSSTFTDDWTLATNIGANGVEADYYVGLETVRGTPDHAGVQLDNVTRSRWKSPCVSHRANDVGTFPEVTDWPTVWRGRLVRLFVTFVAGGELAGGAAAARASAHQIVGILESVSWSDQAWTLECSSIDKLLDREACKGLARAHLSSLIMAPAGYFAGDDRAFTDSPAVHLEQYDPAVGDFHNFWVYVPDGDYSVESFLDALNLAVTTVVDEEGGDPFRGSLSFSLSATSLEISYTTAAGADNRQLRIAFNELATAGEREIDLSVTWGRIVEDPFTDPLIPAEEPAASTTYSVSLPRPVGGVILDGQPLNAQLALAPAPGESSLADFSAAVGDQDLVAVRSSAGVSFFRVTGYSAATGVLDVVPAADPPFRELRHQGTEADPVVVQRACYLSSSADLLDDSGPLVHGLLRLLLSTGQSGFNHSAYDTLPEGVGIEWPHETPSASADSNDSLIDVASFERAFADAGQYAERLRDVFLDPFKVRSWLERRLAFFGFYVTVENGQLKARPGVSVLQHQQEFALTASSVGDVAIAFGRDAGVKGVRYKTGFRDFETAFARTYLLGHLSEQDLAIVEHEDAGVATDDERLLRLAQNTLVEYSKEGWRITCDADRSALDVEPGMVGTFSDEGAADDSSFARGVPHPDGTRGHNATRVVVLSVRTDYDDDDRVQLELYASKLKRGGYSASAWIVSHAGSPSVLTCSANVFSPDADGADASRFAVGDKVRVLAVNPTTAENGEQSFTVDAISGNAITLSGAIDTAGANAHFASGEPLVLTHDLYQTASQTATAKQWCHIGDASGDIGDAGDVCYVW